MISQAKITFARGMGLICRLQKLIFLSCLAVLPFVSSSPRMELGRRADAFKVTSPIRGNTLISTGRWNITWTVPNDNRVAIVLLVGPPENTTQAETIACTLNIPVFYFSTYPSSKGPISNVFHSSSHSEHAE